MPYDCVLKPGEIARIPLGFGLIIPDGFAGYVFPRSSMAAKGLVCELPPIDSGYRGEIHAIISNVSIGGMNLGQSWVDFSPLAKKRLRNVRNVLNRITQEN